MLPKVPGRSDDSPLDLKTSLARGILLQTTEALPSFKQLLKLCVLQKPWPCEPRCSEELPGQRREQEFSAHLDATSTYKYIYTK